MFLSLLLATATTAVTTTAMAAPRDYAAAVAFKGRPAEAMAMDAGRKPAEILDFMQLKPGMKAIDVLTGTGYYAEIMAQVVGAGGSVVAFEPQAMIDAKAKTDLDALAAREPNFRLTTSLPAALTPNTYDFAMIHLNYHDFYWESEKYHFPRIDPNMVLASLFRAMKPGGIVSIVDHVGPAGDTRAIVEKLHRIDPETVKADFKRAGFILEAQSDLLKTPSDDHTKIVFDPAVRGKTDRFAFRFRKPA
ncbi:methyltransferase [Sphingomonas paeninsulae]|uniref:Methyltransferase n=1 Tax=Sphingomonas paeninsulae TaxID=2319844 RepID=A0A494TEQ2_SPHPE|nr:methyltransferase [Sphingomonas paeninsulae]